jgi:hypothetical protein
MDVVDWRRALSPMNQSTSPTISAEIGTGICGSPDPHKQDGSLLYGGECRVKRKIFA